MYEEFFPNCELVKDEYGNVTGSVVVARDNRPHDMDIEELVFSASTNTYEYCYLLEKDIAEIFTGIVLQRKRNPSNG